MKRINSILPTALLGLVFITAAPTASAVLIDFDALPSGSLVTAPIDGVSFTLDNGEYASISSVASGSTSSSPNGLLNAEAFSFASPEGNLTMSFADAVDSLSFYMTFENGDMMLEVFQGAVSSIVNIAFDGDPLDADFVDLSAYAGVTAVTLTHAFPDDYYLIDDISFDVASVPEPASLALLGLGLVGMRISRSKNRKN